jgi:hypothetical protein
VSSFPTSSEPSCLASHCVIVQNHTVNSPSNHLLHSLSKSVPSTTDLTFQLAALNRSSGSNPKQTYSRPVPTNINDCAIVLRKQTPFKFLFVSFTDTSRRLPSNRTIPRDSLRGNFTFPEPARYDIGEGWKATKSTLHPSAAPRISNPQSPRQKSIDFGTMTIPTINPVDTPPRPPTPEHGFATLAVHAGAPHDPVTGAVIESVSNLKHCELWHD